ncbi:hypothetical protein NL676_005624 [Syzygium grande]|nr:hypothetical protein NL676_005624 [Syzygium grande]
MAFPPASGSGSLPTPAAGITASGSPSDPVRARHGDGGWDDGGGGESPSPDRNPPAQRVSGGGGGGGGDFSRVSLRPPPWPCGSARLGDFVTSRHDEMGRRKIRNLA